MFNNAQQYATVFSHAIICKNMNNDTQLRGPYSQHALNEKCKHMKLPTSLAIDSESKSFLAVFQSGVAPTWHVRYWG